MLEKIQEIKEVPEVSCLINNRKKVAALSQWASEGEIEALWGSGVNA